MSGAACAAELARAGYAVSLRDRGRAPGGRMAAPLLHGRRVDIGAAYFTVRDPAFALVVDGWRQRGLAREWTDTLDVVSAGGRSTTTGVARWAAPDGLRALVRDLLTGLDVAQAAPVEAVGVRDGHPTVDGADCDAVVLAMPDPQAARLAGDTVALEWVGYEPVIVVTAGWRERYWPLRDAAFVNDDPDLTLVVDDGSRRGDGAPVLVLHSSADRARQHLQQPEGAVGPLLSALQRTLGVEAAPEWTHAHRWGFAKPVGTHGAAPFGLTGTMIGLAGDSWCPSGAPRVEAAWLSGAALGAELVSRLG